MKKATAATKGLYTRGNIYYVRKVIPAHLREVAGKREFLVSLKTDNYQTAIHKYSDVKQSIDYAISAMKDGTYQKEVLDFDHYSKIAAANGRQLQCLKEILPDPKKVSALVQQIKAADKNKELSKHEIKSYINVKNSDIKLSRLPEIYIEAKKLELKDYNARERARKIDPLKDACKQLQTFLKKDKLLKDITKADARRFHKDLKQRIFEETISANTANKYLTHLRVLITTYYHEYDLDNENVFAGLRFSESRGKRSPLTTDFIAQRWLRNPIFDQVSCFSKLLLQHF